VKVTLTTDGSAAPRNPGPMGAGVVVQDAEGKLLSLASRRLGFGTNNVAEYLAINMALREAAKLGATHVTVYTDSQLCVKQLTGVYAVRNQRLRREVEAIQALAKKFERARFRWQRRTEGHSPAADALASGTPHEEVRATYFPEEEGAE